MKSIKVIFTRRRWNPVSFLIRWACPRSRFALGLSSHCLIDLGDTLLEAHMLKGVREVDRATALKGQTIVKEVRYQVPDAVAGVAWARKQIGARYDWPGALGLGLTPGRDWRQEDKFFCYEYAAAVLHQSGRPVFGNLTHVGETAMMAINP